MNGFWNGKQWVLNTNERLYFAVIKNVSAGR